MHYGMIFEIDMMQDALINEFLAMILEKSL
jgi:hypothetical protein